MSFPYFSESMFSNMVNLDWFKGPLTRNLPCFMENVGCPGMAEQRPPSCSKGAVDAGSSAEFGTAAANGTLEDFFIGKLMKIGLFLAIKLGKFDEK